MARKYPFFQRFKYYLLFITAGLLVHLYLNRHNINTFDDIRTTIGRALFSKTSADGTVCEGIPNIIDGDTLRIGQQKIRLYAIDAPETAQRCQDARNNRYRCGQYATNALRKLIAHQSVRCEKQDTDQYGRMVAICYVKDIEINRWMVKNGYAVAYRSISNAYTLEEELAKHQKLGLWAGTFQMPEKWRKSKS